MRDGTVTTKDENQEESGTNRNEHEWKVIRTFGLLNSNSFHLIHMAARGDMNALLNFSTLFLFFFLFVFNIYFTILVVIVVVISPFCLSDENHIVLRCDTHFLLYTL